VRRELTQFVNIISAWNDGQGFAIFYLDGQELEARLQIEAWLADPQFSLRADWAECLLQAIRRFEQGSRAA